jgi:putative N6-adenine-specific DNA methylase
MFEGKLREFRSEGGVVKTDDEKKAMAEKRRFKQNREFKKRLEEEEENEEGDIRSFVFHKHHPAFKEARNNVQERDFSDGERSSGRERRAARARGEFKKDRRGNDRDFKGGRGDFKGGRRDFKGGKGDFKGGKRGDFKRGGRDFKRKNDDFNDED